MPFSWQPLYQALFMGPSISATHQIYSVSTFSVIIFTSAFCTSLFNFTNRSHMPKTGRTYGWTLKLTNLNTVLGGLLVLVKLCHHWKTIHFLIIFLDIFQLLTFINDYPRHISLYILNWYIRWNSCNDCHSFLVLLSLQNIPSWTTLVLPILTTASFSAT